MTFLLTTSRSVGVPLALAVAAATAALAAPVNAQPTGSAAAPGSSLVAAAADASTATTLLSSPSAVMVRDKIPVVVAVATQFDPNPDVGQVRFVWPTLIGEGTSHVDVVDGMASFTVPGELGSGDRVITATYVPPAGYSESQVNIPVTVSRRPTTTTVTASSTMVSMSVAGDGRPVYGNFEFLLNGQPWETGYAAAWPQYKMVSGLAPGTYTVTGRLVRVEPFGVSPDDADTYALSGASTTFTVAGPPPVPAPAPAPPAPAPVPQPTTTTVKVAKKVKAGRHVRVQVDVTVADGTPVAGKGLLVIRKVGGRAHRKEFKVAGSNAVVKLPKLLPGKYKATVTFRAGGRLMPGSKSKTVTFKVVR